MGIKIAVPAYVRQGQDYIPAERGKLRSWGTGVEIGLCDDDVDLISVKVEDESEGYSTAKVKPSELLEALNIIMEQYSKRLEQTSKTEHSKTRMKVAPYPFRITAGAYLSMTSAEVGALYDEVYKLFKKTLEAKWKQGIKQVVICDGEVTFETEDEELGLSEIIDDIAKKHNRACYTFVAPAAIDSG